MQLPTRFGSLVDSVKDRATVKTVYGDPIKTGNRILVPVARVLMGVGGGEGEGGVGGGASVIAMPLGMYEIDEDETRFLGLNDRRKLFVGLGLGMLLGLVIAGLLRRTQFPLGEGSTDFDI